MADVVKDGDMKKLKEDLEKINNSLKGKKTIENVSNVSDIPTSNSREELYKCVKELYTFSKKVLGILENISVPSNECLGPAISKNIEDMINKQLTEVLPGILKAALESHTTQEKEVKEDTVKEVASPLYHTMEVEIPKDKEKESWKEVVRDACKSIPVNKVAYDPETGVAKMHFNSKENMDKVHDALKSKCKVTPKTVEMKRLLPKLTISGLDPDITTKEKLEEEILSKNVTIKDLKNEGETMKTLFLDKKDRFAVIEVSPKMREAIKNDGDRICVDLERYYVRDRFHVVQCYHCQEYGHMSGSTYCKQKDSEATCFYCAGKHSSRDCCERKKKKAGSMKCSNCSKSKNRTERNLCGAHKASDNLCPFFIREKERMMSRTVGFSEKAKNDYIQRAKGLQRKYGLV